MSVLTQAKEAFDDLIHSGDPTIRTWPMVNSMQPTALTIFTYVMFVKVVGPAFMKDKKPFKPLFLMSLYNFGLVGFYVYFLVMSLYYFARFGSTCFCGSLNPNTTSYGLGFATLGWQLFIVKYLELLDTVFLVLSKKFENISKLHVVHHAVVPIFSWTVLRSETSSYLSVFIFINSLVHTIMYVYYGLALYGSRFKKYLWWKKYLTAIQIIQFMIVTVYMLFMYYIECASAKTTLAFALVLSVLFLVLFINFYRTSYTSQEQKSKDKIVNDTRNENHKLNQNGSSNSKPISNGVSKGSLKPMQNGGTNGTHKTIENGHINGMTKTIENGQLNGMHKPAQNVESNGFAKPTQDEEDPHESYKKEK